MKYMIVIQEHEDDFAERSDEARAPAYWANWHKYFETTVAKADPNYTGAALQGPSTATSIRGGTIHDGPFADSKEQIGGYFIIDVDNLDDALSVASKCPAVGKGGVEVRPVKQID